MTKRLALVVGGTKGFGGAVSSRLTEKGYRVITVGRSSEKNPFHYRCDVGDLSKWRKTLQKIRKKHPVIYLVAFTLGFANPVPFEKLKERDWLTHFTKNFLYIVVAFQELKIKKAFTIGSKWAYQVGMNDLVPYTIAKHALITLGEDLAARNTGLLINNYCVPTMSTPRYYEIRKRFARLGKEEAISHSHQNKLADCVLVAKVIVDFDLANKNSGKNYVVSTTGKISALNAPCQ